MCKYNWIAITTIGNFPTVFSFLTRKKLWISMFVIKFEGKIENVEGNAENIFNFTWVSTNFEK